MKYFFLLVFLCCSVEGFSQKVALKNNLAYDALKTPAQRKFLVGKF